MIKRTRRWTYYYGRIQKVSVAFDNDGLITGHTAGDELPWFFYRYGVTYLEPLSPPLEKHGYFKSKREAVAHFVKKLGYAQLVLSLIMLISSCASSSQPIRIDFSCISKAEGDRLVTNCADAKSWAEWIEKNQRGQWQ